VYVGGAFNIISDFDPGSGGDVHAKNGEEDVFVSMFSSNGDYLGVLVWGGTGYDWVEGLAVAPSGIVYATGAFTETADFDPGVGVKPHIERGVRLLPKHIQL